MDQTNYTNKISIEQVSDSIECVRCRRFAKFYAVTCVVLLLEVALIVYLLSLNDEMQNKVEVYAILGAMFGVGFLGNISLIIYNVSRLKTIERGIGVLPIYNILFENVKTSEMKGTRFVLEIPDGSGKIVETRPMFLTMKPDSLTRKPRTLVPSLYVDDFRGKEVLVMYNPDKNKVYVLDLADNIALRTDSL